MRQRAEAIRRRVQHVRLLDADVHADLRREHLQSSESDDDERLPREVDDQRDQQGGDRGDDRHACLQQARPTSARERHEVGGDYAGD